MSKIVIGQSEGKPLKLDLDLLVPSRLLIQANSGGGKSFLLRRIAEQVWGKVQTIIIDPEGEFYTLREKFGYVLVGEGGETPADIRSAALLAEKFLQLKASAVCDLYEAFRGRPMEQRQWVRIFLDALIGVPRALWHPVLVIVDEAHKFCPQETPKAGNQRDREIISECKNAMISLSTTGRKRGFCAIWATQRLAKVDKDASAEMFNRLVGMTIERRQRRPRRRLDERLKRREARLPHLAADPRPRPVLRLRPSDHDRAETGDGGPGSDPASRNWPRCERCHAPADARRGQDAPAAARRSAEGRRREGADRSGIQARDPRAAN